MPNQIKILLLLLLACKLVKILQARPNDELAARLSLLYLDPSNDERFNDIEHFDDGEEHYTKRKHVSHKEAFFYTTTNKPDEGEEFIGSAEAAEGLNRSMASSIFSFMSNVMRRFIRPL